jgi:hypothetical protein
MQTELETGLDRRELISNEGVAADMPNGAMSRHTNAIINFVDEAIKSHR